MHICSTSKKDKIRIFEQSHIERTQNCAEIFQKKILMYVLNRKHIFAQPLLAFNVEVGSKLWTKFIEKVEIHQRRPNSEHILNYNFGRLQQKTEWGLGSLEVTMASKLFLNLFWLNSLDQPQLWPQNWPLALSKAKKRSVFAVFMASRTEFSIGLPSAAPKRKIKSRVPKFKLDVWLKHIK